MTNLSDVQHAREEFTQLYGAFANRRRTFIVVIAQMIVMIANH